MPFLLGDPELEEREAHDDGEQGVDHRRDGARERGVHAEGALAEARHVAGEHEVDDHDEHGEDRVLPRGVAVAALGLEDPLHLDKEVDDLRHDLSHEEGEEAAEAVGARVGVVEDEELERLRELHRVDEERRSASRAHEARDSRDVGQHVELDELPDRLVLLGPCLKAHDRFPFLRLLGRGVLDKVDDELDDEAEDADDPEAADLHDEGVDHAHVDHAVGHLREGSQRHVPDKEDVEVGLAGLVCARLHGLEDGPHEPEERGAAVVEVAEAHVAADGRALVGDGVAQERLEGGVAHAQDVGGLVGGDVAALVGVGAVGALDLDRGRKADVAAARADAQLVGAGLDLPGVGAGVEVAERLVVEGDGHGLGLAGGELDAREALELLLGAEDLAAGLGDVELHHLGAGDRSGVGHGERGALGGRLHARVCEGGVREAVAEREGDGLAGGVEVAVADVDALAVLGLFLVGGVGGRRRDVLPPYGPGLGELAGGAGLAGDHVERGARAGLAAERAVEDGRGLLHPGGLDAGAGGKKDDDVAVLLHYGLEELDLVLVHAHGRALGALGLRDLVEREGQKDDVGLAGEVEGSFALGVVLSAVALEAGLVADKRKAASVDRAEQGVDLRGVDGGAAGALVARGLGEVADEGDLRGGGKRKQGRGTSGRRVVLQQDAALRRGLAREGVVGVDVEGRGGVLDCLARGEHKLDGLVGALVDVGLGDAALADGGHELAD